MILGPDSFFTNAPETVYNQCEDMFFSLNLESF